MLVYTSRKQRVRLAANAHRLIIFSPPTATADYPPQGGDGHVAGQGAPDQQYQCLPSDYGVCPHDPWAARHGQVGC